jgi:hypothetical protein
MLEYGKLTYRYCQGTMLQYGDIRTVRNIEYLESIVGNYLRVLKVEKLVACTEHDHHC